MSSLNAEQKRQVANWVAEGLSLSDVQKRIATEFKVSMTYIDVRFLVDDLDLTLKNKEEPKAKEPAGPEAPLPGDAVEPGTPPEGVEAGPAPAGAPGGLSLTVDPIQRPGVLVGGTVTFSDGKTGQWQMDQYGQLGFVPPEPGYKPAPADVQQFQVVLDAELRKLGY